MWAASFALANDIAPLMPGPLMLADCVGAGGEGGGAAVAAWAPNGSASATNAATSSARQTERRVRVTRVVTALSSRSGEAPARRSPAGARPSR